MASAIGDNGFVWRVSFVRQTTGQEWSGYGPTLDAAIANLRELAETKVVETERDAETIREALEHGRQA